MWLWVPTPPPFSPFAAASILISISISKTAIYHKHLACYKHIIQHPTTLWPLRRLASRYHSPRWMIFDSALFTSSQRLSMSLCVHMSIKQNKSLVWCVYVINFTLCSTQCAFPFEIFSRSFSFALVFILICFFFFSSLGRNTNTRFNIQFSTFVQIVYAFCPKACPSQHNCIRVLLSMVAMLM